MSDREAQSRKLLADTILQYNPQFIIGVDEVGYGCIAGPCVIGAVGVPVDWVPPKGLTDSKLLSREKITALAYDFMNIVSNTDYESGIHSNLIFIPHYSIDQHGLGKSRRDGIISGVSSVRGRYSSDDRVLSIVDGNLDISNSVSIPKADLTCPAVSMASVIAKYYRDLYMISEADKLYPNYGFASHVGYDTAAHRQAIKDLGPCEIHRMSTRTLKERQIWAALPNLGRGKL